MGLFNSLEKENRIFKNEGVFNQDHIPEEIIHREKEIKEIAYSLRGVVDGNGENIFLHGPTGTGKTSSAKYVLKELGDYSEKALGIYLNCWHYSTRYSVLNQIAYSLDEFIPRRGLAPDQLIETITNFSKKYNKTPIVVLDEVDTLSKRKEEALLYDLLRIGESLGGKIVCILITNDYEFVTRLDRRIKSSFVQKSIQFVPYRPSELRDILKERAKIGLLPGSYDEDIIGACAGFGAKNKGDARVSIRLLWSAGKEAERAGKNKIEIIDVEKGKKQVMVELKDEKKEHLNENDKKVLEKIEKEWIESSKLYERIKLDKRLVRMSLENLENFGFIEIKNQGERKAKLIKIKS